MKNRGIQKLLSALMAMLVLISTLSFSIEKHYCGEDLVDVAFFIHTKKCGPEVTHNDFDRGDQKSVLRMQSCCKHVVDLLKGQDQFSWEKTKLIIKNQKALGLILVSVTGTLNYLKPIDISPLIHFSPPAYVIDIRTLHQVYLI